MTLDDAIAKEQEVIQIVFIIITVFIIIKDIVPDFKRGKEE